MVIVHNTESHQSGDNAGDGDDSDDDDDDDDDSGGGGGETNTPFSH